MRVAIRVGQKAQVARRGEAQPSTRRLNIAGGAKGATSNVFKRKVTVKDRSGVDRE